MKELEFIEGLLEQRERLRDRLAYEDPTTEEYYTILKRLATIETTIRKELMEQERIELEQFKANLESDKFEYSKEKDYREAERADYKEVEDRKERKLGHILTALGVVGGIITGALGFGAKVYSEKKKEELVEKIYEKEETGVFPNKEAWRQATK